MEPICLINNDKGLKASALETAIEKSKISTYIVLLIVFMLFVGNAYSQWSGSGTESSPYLITSKSDLETLATNVNGGNDYSDKYFKVTTNITGSGNKMTEIIGMSGKLFKGHFNGGNNTIELDINVSGTVAGGGLFGQVSGAVIKNVIVTGTVNYNYNSVGGIVGQAKDGSLIENCINYATLANANSQRAGIAGGCYSSTIIGCENHADIDCSGQDYVAGIAAYLSNDSNIENCINYGKITGRGKIGGIVGESAATNYPASIINCVNDAAATINGSNTYQGTYVGGIVGYSSSSNSNYATSWTTFSRCENHASVSGWTSVGGILGYFTDSRTDYTQPISKMTDCSNSGTVSASYGYVGGLVGNIYSAHGYLIIDKCANTGSGVNSSYKSRIGGLIGLCGYPAKVYNSYNTANVSCSNSSENELYMGGLIGEHANNSVIKNCYNIGNVSGLTNGDGGLIGGVAGANNGIIQNCYNGGTISRNNAMTGGVVGKILANSSMSNVYFLKDCGEGSYGTISVFGTSTGDAPTNYSDFTHYPDTSNRINTSITAGGTTFGSNSYFLNVLNTWVSAQNAALIPGTYPETYLSWVNASNASDNRGMPKFFTCTPLTFASAPSLSATDRQITVTWDDLGASSYVLYYGATDPNSGVESVWNVPLTGTSYPAERLTNGQTYYFAVKAIGDGTTYCADNPLSDAVSGAPHCP